MTEDILAQAEKLSTYQIRHKQFSIDEFGNARMNRETGEYFWACSALFPQLLAEAKKWKAKAIEDRARLIYCDSEDVEDPTWWSQEDDEYKKPFRERATRELEGEIMDEQRGEKWE